MISKFSSTFNMSHKNKALFVFLSVFILGFVIGVVGIRYDYIKNGYYFIKDIPTILNGFVYAFEREVANYEIVSIDMKFKEYQIITKNRDRNIKEGHAVYNKEDWAKGKISFFNDGSKLKAKIRLKGTMSDNWIDSNGKWSFRVKLKGKGRYDGMKEFSLFRPSVGSGILEWLFQKIAMKEGLLALDTRLVKLHINGKNLGYYYLQEHYNKVLIEKNKRREGPIVGYSKDRIVKLWYSDPSQILKVNGFNVANIKVTGSVNKSNNKQQQLSSYAAGLLENLRNKKNLPSEIIEVDAMAKLLALRAIIGSSELDWKDIKFYYNPLSSKLEPIVREAHADYDLFDWWYRGTRPYISTTKEYTTFEDIMFSDVLIYGKFMEYLMRYTQEDIAGQYKINNKGEYRKVLSALVLTNDGTKWIRAMQVRNKKIKAALSYPDPIDVYLGEENQLIIRNYQSFPIIVNNLFINSKRHFSDNMDVLIDGKINDEMYYDSKHSFGLKDGDLQNIIVTYSLYGSNQIKEVKVKQYSLRTKPAIDHDLYLDKFYVNDGVLYNKDKRTTIDSTVIIPKKLKLVFSPGSILTFIEGGQLIAQGGIELNGKVNDRIVVNSTSDARQGGIFVSEVEAQNIIKFTDVSGLKGVSIDNKMISGGLNFYKTNILIKNSTFSRNYKSDDYINVVNSVFHIENIAIYGSNADSIDVDFSKGEISNVKIFDSGNDGLDFSGSHIALDNVYIESSTDKAISVGENSKISASSVEIKNSFIGVAVKDGASFIADKVVTDNNKFDYACFVKKIEYGEPELVVRESNNNAPYLLGENSKMIINGVTHTENTNNVKELLY